EADHLRLCRYRDRGGAARADLPGRPRAPGEVAGPVRRAGRPFRAGRLHGMAVCGRGDHRGGADAAPGRSGPGRASARPAAAAHCSPAGQLQLAIAAQMLLVYDERLHQVRRQLLDRARHTRGAAELTARLYGVGPVTGLALTCWLGGAGRFSSSRKAVRFAGLDITVYSSDGKRSPGHLSRQGPEVLRWCLYEAGKAHARASAPDHAYYAQVKERIDG